MRRENSGEQLWPGGEDQVGGEAADHSVVAVSVAAAKKPMGRKRKRRWALRVPPR
jgi:hypothetical protein